jgi:subtilisin family serine protease
VVVVASAGNDGEWGVKYPAAFPDVISVGATRLARSQGALWGKRASYSQKGFRLDLMAPAARSTPT